MSNEMVAILVVGAGLAVLWLGVSGLIVTLLIWSELRRQERHNRLEVRYDRLEALFDGFWR